MQRTLKQPNEPSLESLIQGCIQQDRTSQHKLYKKFYRYVMYIAFLYTNDEEEARAILNDSFFKVFTKIDSYNNKYPFKPWFRRITVNTAINQYRKNAKNKHFVELTVSHDPVTLNDALGKLSYDELVEMLDVLPAQYKMVFTLHVIEGYTHDEIAKQLNIQTGTSKSNLHRAKKILQKKLINNFDINYGQQG